MEKQNNEYGIIYKVTNLINGKCYIGKTVKTLERRKTEHCSKNNQIKNSYLRNAIKKYGKEHFSWEVIEKCLKEDLNWREKYYIQEYKSLVTENGYNLTTGGDGASYGELNVSKREDVKEKLRVKNTGFKHSLETIEKMRKNSLEYYKDGMSDEQKLKISIASMGHYAKKGKDSALSKEYTFISPENIEYIIKGVREFAREHNLDHSSLVKLSKGKLKTHKGWRFKNNDQSC